MSLYQEVLSFWPTCDTMRVRLLRRHTFVIINLSASASPSVSHWFRGFGSKKRLSSLSIFTGSCHRTCRAIWERWILDSSILQASLQICPENRGQHYNIHNMPIFDIFKCHYETCLKVNWNKLIGQAWCNGHPGVQLLKCVTHAFPFCLAGSSRAFEDVTPSSDPQHCRRSDHLTSHSRRFMYSLYTVYMWGRFYWYRIFYGWYWLCQTVLFRTVQVRDAHSVKVTAVMFTDFFLLLFSFEVPFLSSLPKSVWNPFSNIRIIGAVSHFFNFPKQTIQHSY